MSFHKQTFHQESFIEKLKDVFRGGGFDKPTEVQHEGDYYQVITHSTNVVLSRRAFDLLKKHGKHITGIGYTNKKGILLHIAIDD